MLCPLTVTKTTNAFLHTENSSMTDMFWRCTGRSYKRKHALWNESKKLGYYDYASFIFHDKENGHARRGCSSILCEKGYFYIHLSRDFQERTTTVFSRINLLAVHTMPRSVCRFCGIPLHISWEQLNRLACCWIGSWIIRHWYFLAVKKISLGMPKKGIFSPDRVK